MTTYNRGDVVLVRFPMPDIQEYKPRPALIIQNDENNRKLTNTILLQITSNLANKDQPTQFFIDLKSPAGQITGLLHNSVIKAEVIFTLPQSNIFKKLGSLPEPEMIKVEECIKTALGIQGSN